LHSQDPTQAVTSSKDITRGLSSVGSGWLPDPKGYVLLAACRPSESAYEYAFERKMVLLPTGF
jgi:hypothetical protein